MDLTKQKSNWLSWKLFSQLLYLPNYWFLYQLIKIGLQTDSSELLLFEFIRIRNILYIIYVITGMILGVIIVLNRFANITNKNQELNIFIPEWVANIILTTFAYTIVSIILKTYRIFTYGK